jgi:hypothetical protein
MKDEGFLPFGYAQGRLLAWDDRKEEHMRLEVNETSRVLAVFAVNH